MKSTLIATAAALALAMPATVAFAQDETVVATDASGDVFVMTDTQQMAHDGWPAERQADYDGWPDNYKVYYWTLTPVQQEGWWVLTPDQRGKVLVMTPEQQAAAWTSITAQMNGAPPPAASGTAAAATTAAATASTAAPRFVSNEVVQSTPADTNPPSGDLPVCSKNQQDNCINAWEAGKRGKGVTKPLNKWPGKPASEMKK